MKASPITASPIASAAEANVSVSPGHRKTQHRNRTGEAFQTIIVMHAGCVHDRMLGGNDCGARGGGVHQLRRQLPPRTVLLVQLPRELQQHRRLCRSWGVQPWWVARPRTRNESER